MGRPASPDYWRQWRAAHPAYRERERERAGRDAGPATARRRRGDREWSSSPWSSAPHPLLTWAQELATGLVREDGRARLSDELYPDVVGEILLAKLERQDPVATSDRLATSGALLAPPPRAAAGRRLSGGWHRSRVCACRGCEHHAGACGWPTTNERRCDRCGRPGFANRFRRTPDHPIRRTSAWRRLAKRTVEAHVAVHGWQLSRLASRAAPGATRRARGRPSGAARPRWRAAAGAARRPLRELQRAEGVEPAAAVSRCTHG